MRVESVTGGLVVLADATLPNTVKAVHRITGDAPLIIADPPYGNILPEEWDTWGDSEAAFVQWMLAWTRQWADVLSPNAAMYVWGGIGTPGFRPFFGYLSRVELETKLKIANLVTWKKRRAYGVQHNYLFTREECVYLFNGPDVKKPRCFNVPYLEELRGYPGFNKKHPAHDERYRRTNVWADITEVMQGKVHPAQKAQRVMEIPIEVHTQPGECVIDPFAGSGTTALAARKLDRRFVVIERDEETFEKTLGRLRA